MTRAMAALACAVVVACAPARAPAPAATRVNAPAAAEARSDGRYRALTALLAHNPATGAPVDSIAELVPLLDEELRSSFTLVFATRSPQQDVDPVHPRVVLFGHDARLVLAFTGDPTGQNRDILEVVHFRDDARAFELERFVLPAAVRRDPALAASARANGHPNPTECLRCHGADPRPIFDSYPVWPGFYGSAQDAFATDPAELASYRRFLASKDAPGSVYHLLAFPPGSEVSPYALTPAEDTSGNFAPNMRLGMALTERNRERIARKLEAAPGYAMYRDKLVAGLLECAPLPVTSEARARVRATLAAENAAKLDRARITDPDERHRLRMVELNSSDNFAEIEYMARVLDVSRADWSMAIETGAFALYDGILSGRVVGRDGARDFYFKEDFLFEMLRGRVATDPHAAALFAIKPYAIDHRAGTRLDLPRAIAGCATFAAETNVAAVAWPPAPPAPPLVVYRCVRCHDPGGDGPPLPFDSPVRLHALLTAQPAIAAEVAARTLVSATDRMPRDQTPLVGADRGALLAYLQAIAAGQTAE